MTITVLEMKRDGILTFNNDADARKYLASREKGTNLMPIAEIELNEDSEVTGLKKSETTLTSITTKHKSTGVNNMPVIPTEIDTTQAKAAFKALRKDIRKTRKKLKRLRKEVKKQEQEQTIEDTNCLSEGRFEDILAQLANKACEDAIDRTLSFFYREKEVKCEKQAEQKTS